MSKPHPAAPRLPLSFFAAADGCGEGPDPSASTQLKRRASRCVRVVRARWIAGEHRASFDQRTNARAAAPRPVAASSTLALYRVRISKRADQGMGVQDLSQGLIPHVSQRQRKQPVWRHLAIEGYENPPPLVFKGGQSLDCPISFPGIRRP